MYSTISIYIFLSFIYVYYFIFNIINDGFYSVYTFVVYTPTVDIIVFYSIINDIVAIYIMYLK